MGVAPLARSARVEPARAPRGVRARRCTAVGVLPPGIEFITVPAVEISSTAVRERVRRGQSIRYWVPDAVADFIADARAVPGRSRMIKQLIASVFGTRHEREVRRLQPLVDAIHVEEARLKDLTDARDPGADRDASAASSRSAPMRSSWNWKQVRAARHGSADATEREGLEDRFQELDARYRKTIADVLDEILPEAFATVREACRRLVGTTVSVTGHDLTWDMVPYDVQLIGGIVLHQGRIAEMATGEGKTLVATLPLYLNALTGRGAHLVTVNNYLARRDSQWMGHVFRWLGLTVACLDDTEPSTPERRAAYLADITYGTNNEFGFDYLRDNMVFGLEQRVQREYVYAIIDEVDSILIDEARTPLIISGPVAHEGDDSYARFNRQVFELVRKQTDVVNGAAGRGREAARRRQAPGRGRASSCTRRSSACRRASAS